MTPRERLAFLANKLREPLPKNLTFNIRVWMTSIECGTAACAIGYATLVPELAADGLILEKGSLIPFYKGNWEYDACAVFFGIKVHLAKHFFHPDNYPKPAAAVTAQDVAERIERWMAKPYETG